MANNRSSSIEESKISKQVTKGDLLALLKNARANRRVVRFFSGSSSVRKLEKFVNHDLRDTQPYQLLSKAQIDSLIQMLRERFHKKIKKRSKHDYRHAPDEFANKIFRDLARLISDDPKILALVQAYEADRTLMENSFIFDTQERLFITEYNYVMSFCSIINIIKSSLNPSIEDELRNHIQMAQPYITYFSSNDINKLKNDPAIAAEIDNLKKRVESLKALKERNTVYIEPFSQHAIPQLKQPIQKHKIEEVPLRPSTIMQLTQLADGLLNSQELASPSDDLPIALEHFIKFNDFYQNLDSVEKRRLDNQWIIPSYGSQKGIKFGDYYPTINQSGIEGVGYALYEMVNKIQPSNESNTNENRQEFRSEDIDKLNADSYLRYVRNLAAKRDNVKKESMKFVNAENLLGDPLTQFNYSQIFKTDDGYGLTNDELVEIFKAQNTLYNPYNNRPFSQNEMSKAMAIPQLGQLIQKSKTEAASLRPSTIKQLKQLAEGLLNAKERGSHAADLPIALGHFAKFNDFYQDLDSPEKRKLDNLWIVPWTSSGTGKGMKFSDYYPTIHRSCVHEAGVVLNAMIPTIKPSNEDAPTDENRRAFRP